MKCVHLGKTTAGCREGSGTWHNVKNVTQISNNLSSLRRCRHNPCSLPSADIRSPGYLLLLLTHQRTFCCGVEGTAAPSHTRQSIIHTVQDACMRACVLGSFQHELKEIVMSGEMRKKKNCRGFFFFFFFWYGAQVHWWGGWGWRMGGGGGG